MTEDSKLLPCPFCNAAIRHVESLARSFDPPRAYHEYHHPRNDCILYDGGMISGFSDDPAPRLKWIEAWNRRAASVNASRSGEEPRLWFYETKAPGRRGGVVTGVAYSKDQADDLRESGIEVFPLYTTPRPSELVAALRATDAMISRAKDALTGTGKGTHHSTRLIRIIIDAALATPGLAASRPTHRHLKSDHLVRVIGIGKMQSDDWMVNDINRCGVDMREVVIYEHDGNLWARPREEFEDGRFAALTPVEGV